MTPRQIIIQAGGRGSRLEQHTSNKPKCLVPVDGKPLLYHTLDAFPGAEAVVIVDYRADVVARWIEAFPPDRPVRLVRATGVGSAAGIAEAAKALPYPDEPVAVVWCDLLFEKAPDIECYMHPVIFTTAAFDCRIKTQLGGGVAGLFYLPTPRGFAFAPTEGEFATWLLNQGACQQLDLPSAREYGTIAALEDHWSDTPSRFFNDITIEAEMVTKRARLRKYESKLADEAAWYERVRGPRFGNVPEVYGTDPLRLARVGGQHPWQMKPDQRVLMSIMDVLERLHGLETAPFDQDAVAEMYLQKPINRMVVAATILPPELRGKTVVINSRPCKNRVLGGVWSFDIDRSPFRLIHGDPTFSNIIISGHGFPFLIDPRGRFGSTQFFGDPLYDWAKLWYSLVGGYDNFNRKQFTLEMGDGWADVQIKPSPWAFLSPVFEERLGAAAMRKIKIIHGLIWLSLVGYVADDYDAMLAAYFKGLLVLEEALG